jgi:hypothetical protein
MSHGPVQVQSVTSTSRYSFHHQYHNQISSAVASFGHQEARTSAYYCINEDDMITIEDVMMCPYVFRTKNGVLSGALADCIMPGMLRAHFSPTNKLLSMEMVFDAMGVMQQLDGANGGDITAQVIPGCLEMALLPCQHEARVITDAKPPYNILHVNEAWTRMTKYTQLEVEGKPLLPLLSGHRINSDGNLEAEPAMMMGPNTTLAHNLDEVSHGRSTFSTSIHYRKYGKPFVDFMCSYPLTK